LIDYNLRPPVPLPTAWLSKVTVGTLNLKSRGRGFDLILSMHFDSFLCALILSETLALYYLLLAYLLPIRWLLLRWVIVCE